MDFRVTEDQRELAAGVRAFAKKRYKAPLDRELMGELADLGVLALCEPEDKGGLARPFSDAVVVFEEVGRALLPGVAAWTHLAGEPERVVGGIEAATTPVMIEHAAELDALLVLHDDHVERVDATALDVVPVATPLDPLTPVGRAASLPRGEKIGGPDEAVRLRQRGTALAAAQLVGIAGATLELAVEYAKVREQFGRAIGSFQAVKHILADMFVRLEVARAAVYAAGATIDTPEVGSVDRAVTIAKLKAADAALANARACIQVHGGMGYTWEIDAHYFLKRAFVLETVFGTREALAKSLGR